MIIVYLRSTSTMNCRRAYLPAIQDLLITPFFVGFFALLTTTCALFATDFMGFELFSRPVGAKLASLTGGSVSYFHIIRDIR